MRIALPLDYIEKLGLAYFPFNSLSMKWEITEASDIHLGKEQASWNEERGGRDCENKLFTNTSCSNLSSDRLNILQEQVSYYIPLASWTETSLAENLTKVIKPFQT